ncbi:hypothetical protein NDA18_000014 [Ustilago nuda]|nr:hypothetical protein NDA18_000014 [Ustilago nuda]
MSTSQKLPTASADGYKPGKSIMHALNYQGKRDVRVSTVDKPTITDPADIPDLEKAQILGHECVGTVEHYCKAKQFSIRILPRSFRRRQLHPPSRREGETAAI